VKHTLQIPAADLANINFIQIVIADAQTTNMKTGSIVYKSGGTEPTKNKES
jgi:hypothetical protein